MTPEPALAQRLVRKDLGGFGIDSATAMAIDQLLQTAGRARELDRHWAQNCGPRPRDY